MEQTDGQIDRIEFGELEPYSAHRTSPATCPIGILRELLVRLDRIDARANGAAWTRRVLDLLHAHPERRAGDLCEMVGQDKASFKLKRTSELKNLGLTESLEVGYRLSPRGMALRDELRRRR